MLGNNAAARKEDAPTRLSPSRRTAAAPCPAPRAHGGDAGGGGDSRLLRDTRAGELPRLTYTLFILTLVSRAFVIFNEKLALHHRGEGVCQPSPLPESCSPAPCAGQIFRGAPFLRDAAPLPSTLSLCKPRAPLCRRERAQLAPRVECSGPDGQGVCLPLLLPRSPVPAALSGQPDTPAWSRGAALTRSLPAAALNYPAGHGNYFACGKQHRCAGAGRAASEPWHARPGTTF